MTVQAAIDGIGVAIGRTSYVQTTCQGPLVFPSRSRCRGCRLLPGSPQAKQNSPKLSAFFGNGWSPPYKQSVTLPVFPPSDPRPPFAVGRVV